MAAGGTAARAGAATSLRSSCWSRAARAASNLRSLRPGVAGGWVTRSLPGAGVERGEQQQQEHEAAQRGDQAEAGQRGGEAGAGGHQLQLASV